MKRTCPASLLFCLAVLCPLAGSALPNREDIRTAISDTRTFKQGEDERAFRLIDHIINESKDDAGLRSFIESQLAGVLGSRASAEAKQRICYRLHLIGTNASVPVLSGLLESADAKLVEAACYALSANTSEVSRQALRNALTKASGNGLVAIIHLLGENKDDDSTMPLIALGNSKDPKIQAAVFKSLGSLANTPATEFLTKQLGLNSNQTRRLAALALSQAAQNLEHSAHPDMAGDLYALLISEQLPPFIRRGAYLGSIRVFDYEAIEDVIAAIRGEDSVLSAAAISMIPKLKGSLATLRIVSLVPELIREKQTLIVNALAERGDAAAVPGLLDWLDDDSEIGMVTLRAIGRLGNADFVPVLLRRLKNADSGTREVILGALARIKGETVDRLLLDELERLKGKQKIEIIELLAERNSVVAVATLFQMARGEDSSLNRAALHALRTCGRVEHMPLVVELLKTHDRSPTLRFVRETLASLAQKSSHSGISGTEVLTALAQNESPHIRVELIHVMGMVRDPAALEYLEEVFEDSDSGIRLKAYESAIRIAQMSVSRQEDNPEVNSVLQVLSEQADQPIVRERAKSLLNKKSE